MKLVQKTLLATALLSSTTLYANVLEGHRIGLGFNSTSIDDVAWEDKYSTSGFTLAYGYDINDIVGINLSLNKGSGSESIVDIDTSTFKFDADIGYTFHMQNASIKPYGVLGFAKFKEEYSILGQNISKWDDSTIFAGIGTRATFNQHFYTDLRLDFINLKESGDNIFADQFSFTVGYKF
ncbi:porin family protein [Aliivibrio fischeri]|uniref:porin family protein n=1 Tax=Aliivibrio fischeri TaxID=668 RepID=UPI0012D9554B|nr:porin family protein [Aliivibrio fischeri]MUK68296.1 outer membrane beta-barrel protein [Aliivibrio fischeri]MUK73840.1 outer membrane beta-barrel protein [Aliivibrio fischeri]MUK75767.1 outer membrane beta-barrel protein [Aliivibrio fischeri]